MQATAKRLPELAPLGRRMLSLAYEALLLAAVVLAGGAVLVPLTRQLNAPIARPALQLGVLALCAVYFIWQWLHGGQTLAMKTWRVGLLSADGTPVDFRRALARFLYAAAGTLLAGAGFIWALADRDRQFLHDRLAGTRIVRCAR